MSCSLMKKSTVSKPHNLTPSTSDTLKKVKSDSLIKAIKSYKDVITNKAISQVGLFSIHKIDQKYFFEIPQNIFEKDILITTRIEKAAVDIRPQGGFYGFAGDLINERIIRFSRGPNDKVFIRAISYSERAADSTLNGMMRSLENSNLQPIISAFDIKAFTTDSAAVVIDASDFLNSDNSILYFDNASKNRFNKLGGLQADKSYIESVKAFPVNIEIHSLRTYLSDGNPASYELNTSILLLPKEQMKPRYADKRVGYYEHEFTDFDATNGAKKESLITRWRLEPKKEDEVKYLKGELVEPKKPIVYYIDPTTPKKWVPYLIQGVNDWQKAFEQAGFKNAIYALVAPINDPDFNLLDARHNAIIYKPSTALNAMGKSVV